MKLKNRNTGVIGDLVAYDAEKGIFAVKAQGGDRCYYYSLAALHEVWEDYEETKKYWLIECDGEIVSGEYEGISFDKDCKEIGNYFSSREEAEETVEKLKALTEAKEDGLKIKGYYYNHEDLVILADIGKCNKLTLDTLFEKEID